MAQRPRPCASADVSWDTSKKATEGPLVAFYDSTRECTNAGLGFSDSCLLHTGLMHVLEDVFFS